MSDANDKIKVIDCAASDNVYMHKDFHGALGYAIKYLDETLGEEATREYLTQVGKTYFAPLSERLRGQGLSALENHWRKTFGEEGGRFDLRYEGDVLVLEVKECPAVAHMKAHNQFSTERFCETTVVVNETVCGAAGYECECTYVPGAGTCVQRFWKKGART